mmetsp:Transcript_18615/g.40312  ORF Transcript_18615/g.40312 Transcript_18615/m.40312 type:complete len:585 (-) Transcript_18615:56-1810(-)|eukprot:CAMPEP_0178513658 /NCGR_PEP_ID=MMETSP0696-20121128/23599_1 /TAXON_ID=265572 /ORGANISM="Extubocellulus spinifer, Strain CCMP396" /LENGTH=584 /DNA_ID=CAMNT_0020143685 /DNA_START=35 /DNA_END=1789 /DNA_ORIENTATION=+
MTSISGNAWHDELVQWIRRNGGEIHPNLTLDAVNDTSRGIKASQGIEKGELLIRLPGNLALDGSSLPLTFIVESAAASSGDDNNKSSDTKQIAERRTASAWLRCLTSLLTQCSRHRGDRTNNVLKEQSEIDFGPYLDSLPDSYDTLLDASSWPDEDVSTLLGGTALGMMVEEERRNHTLKERCNLSVKPYLKHVGLWAEDCDDEEKESSRFNEFQRACACVSTRGFHLQQKDGETAAEESAQGPADGNYSGPYLLPYIDLLNHSTEKKCTTLQRDTSDGTFTMIAERPINAGEEICHAYGKGLTSAQLLQTFGFVETGASKRAAGNEWSGDDEDGSDGSNGVRYGTTPVTISAQAVLRACRSVIDSSFPEELRDTMEENDIPDETWGLPTEERDILSHGLISDDIIAAVDKPLPDELVTLCCLPFMPDEVYAEWSSDSCLWSAEILEDYFLGKLALRSLMKVLGAKMEQYSALDSSACGFNVLVDDEHKGGGQGDPDVLLLKRLLKASSKDIVDESKRRRAIYALTIRLEEKHCLRVLQKEMINVLRSLDDDEEDRETDNDDGQSGKRSSSDIDGASSSKKIKL